MEQHDAIRLDTISVVADVNEELKATGADLDMILVGTSFYTGSAALKKTKEVNELVAALAAVGVSEKDVHLQSVSAAAASAGVLKKSSSARYHLRVHCEGLEQVGEAIGVITAQKNTELQPIRWRYPGLDGLHDRLLDTATRLAHDRARRIAAHLGIRLAGVHRFDEKLIDPEQQNEAALDALRTMDCSIDRTRGVPLEIAVSHLKEVRLRVEVDYYVSDYVGPPPTLPA